MNFSNSYQSNPVLQLQRNKPKIVWQAPLKYGKATVYDIRESINLSVFKTDFDNLQIDPYVKQGFRRKHIARFDVNRLDVHQRLDDDDILFQSSKHNPTHGDQKRKYPRFTTTNASAQLELKNTVQLFVDIAKVSGDVLFQAQRITCTPGKEGLPSVENWHHDGVIKIGIICVERSNVSGGRNEFRHPDGDIIGIDLPVGHMIVFEDEIIEHRVTPIHVEDDVNDGFRDVILFGFPSTSF